MDETRAAAQLGFDCRYGVAFSRRSERDAQRVVLKDGFILARRQSRQKP